MEMNPTLSKEFHDHSHDDDIQSIYVEDSHPMSMDKLDRFFSLVMDELGGQILRSKGVVYAAGQDNRILFQGVHTHLNSFQDRPWEPHETRKTKMVFIGRYIPKDVLQEGLEMCRAV